MQALAWAVVILLLLGANVTLALILLRISRVAQVVDPRHDDADREGYLRPIRSPAEVIR